MNFAKRKKNRTALIGDWSKTKILKVAAIKLQGFNQS